MKVLIQTDKIDGVTYIKLVGCLGLVTPAYDKQGNMTGLKLGGLPDLVLVDDVTNRRHDLVNGPHAP